MDKLSAAVVNGNYQNPILPMDFSDPDAVRVGEDYYLISSSFTYLPGVPVLHSKDLVHWERIGNCVERLPFDRYAQPAHGCGTWAPALRYHAGRFYAFIPLPDEGIFYTEATDPAGPWSALHCVKSASGWIDPCPLWDDDGSVYMAHAFAKSRCGIKHKIQLSRLDPETLEVVEDGPIVFDGTLSQPTAEGPKMYKRNGWYYIFIPAGGVEYGWQTVLRARNVYGPYEEKIVMHQGASSINGPHQGAWVTAPDGSDWFLHFQDRFELGRVVHLQPMCWHSDWPFIGLEQNGDGIGDLLVDGENSVLGLQIDLQRRLIRAAVGPLFQDDKGDAEMVALIEMTVDHKPVELGVGLIGLVIGGDDHRHVVDADPSAPFFADIGLDALLVDVFGDGVPGIVPLGHDVGNGCHDGGQVLYSLSVRAHEQFLDSVCIVSIIDHMAADCKLLFSFPNRCGKEIFSLPFRTMLI